MNHWHYVSIAYISFTIFLSWDFFVPQWTLKKSIRAIALKARRRKSI
jgi:hypothetical protein